VTFVLPLFGSIVLVASFATGRASTWPLRHKRSEQPGVFSVYVVVWAIFTAVTLWLAVRSL
jgi:hypothetical protein